jgi:hypothetical protein
MRVGINTHSEEVAGPTHPNLTNVLKCLQRVILVNMLDRVRGRRHYRFRPTLARALKRLPQGKRAVVSSRSQSRPAFEPKSFEQWPAIGNRCPSWQWAFPYCQGLLMRISTWIDELGLRIASFFIRFGADRAPGHLVHPLRLDVLEASVPEELFDFVTRPVVRDFRQHLIKDNRA